MTFRLLFVRTIIIIAALTTSGQFTHASGWITGQGRFEKITGVPSMGHQSRRLGAPPGQPPTGDGYYRIDNLPAGIYSVYVNQPDFFASPKVVPNVEILDGQETVVNVDLDLDYSTYFRDSGQWTDWQWDWYQTFLATGTSVRGVSWMMAGWGEYDGDVATIGILEDNGDPDVRNWTLLGSKTDNSISSDSDEWVRWPSGQIPLMPGKQYAVHINVTGGCAIYKRDKDGSSYPHGKAYDLNGNQQNYDLNVTVFVDRNNQSVTHTRLGPGPGLFDGGLSDIRWGQTFVATGTSLAAADLFAASGDENFDLTWRIRQGGPSGAQVGPTKTTQGAYFASSTDLVGVSYNPNDVMLVPGEIYCIEVSDTGNFTPYIQESENSYPDGAAFRNGVTTAHDLAMTIVEYTPPQQARTPDLYEDGRVDFKDFSKLAKYWRQEEDSVDIAPLPLLDGTVNFKDLNSVAEDWLTATGIPPLPGPATGPRPYDGARDVDLDYILSWTAGADAASHDVYFGKADPPPFIRNQTTVIYDPNTMDKNATYYWRVDEVNLWGTTTGTVWRFTTGWGGPPV
ncbi:MAG: carboxypeptidase-like regulatory domain-containing protein [Planctomycetota bacterium]|jgi:hypothetical protein